MNDTTEYIHALKVIKETIFKLYDFELKPNLLDVFPSDKLVEPIFSFSLSENKDLLSQWRGYCPDGGYSISFFDEESLGQINRMMEMHNLYIGKCIYYDNLTDSKEIENFIKKMIIEISPEEYKMKKASLDGNHEEYTRGIYYKAINNTFKYAPLIKHSAFSEECEWRIIAGYAESRVILKAPTNLKITPTGDGFTATWNLADEYIPFEQQDLKFRQGKSFLIPYIEIPLSEDDEQVNLTEIVVGPTPHMELAIKSCELLLSKNNNVKISASILPYRNW
ncbi:DUF2971 domain-containing protein [Pontibacter beigongshangensis]|uniref:DUF2971 domain-containing protein n=1 Tax=Pontibacter beigongshangensis TaxID=2574733 RepID=UPI001650B61C|nr:DUF2971 domain-containing protein [Pontibacter beigongshangensis]